METETNEVLSVESAGKRCGLSRGASYAAVRRKQLPALRFGRKLVVPVKALDRMLETGTPIQEAGKREEVAA